MDYSELVRRLTDENDCIIYLADIDTYEVLYLNHTAKKRLEIPLDDESYRGSMCYELMQGKRYPCEFCNNSYLSTNCFYKWEYYNPVLKENLFIRDKLIVADGRRLRYELAEDTTQAKQAQLALEHRLLVEETLVACIQTLSEGQDIDATIGRLLKIIGEYYQADRAYIYEMDSSAQGMVNTYGWQKDGASPVTEELLPASPGDLADWSEKLKREGAFYMEAMDGEHDFAPLVRRVIYKQETRNIALAPMLRDGEVIGFIGVDNPRRNASELSLLQNLTYFVLDDLGKRRTVMVLERLSYRDALTGAYNRNRYMEKIQEYDSVSPSCMGIIYTDLNGLKVANDTYGHQYGDSLLVEVAGILRKIFGEGVFRIGGDEFVVLCQDMGRPEFEEKVAVLRQEVQAHERISLSVGSRWESGMVDIHTMMYMADKQMYLEKQSYYHSNHFDVYNHRTILAAELQGLIARGDFFLCYQPIVNLHENRVTGAEALIRRRGTGGDIIMPDRFIPSYEREGIIRHVDFFALELTCRQLREWDARGLRRVTVAVNFSRYTLMEYYIVESIQSVCAQYGISPDRIEIEVTEGIGKMGLEELRELAEHFHQAGFSLSLDDFGSKYANLSVLTEVSFDKIKLDKSLTSQVLKKDMRVIRHVIDLCKEMRHVSTLAEGVETLEQLEALRAYDCDYVQGYYYSKPLEPEAFARRYLTGAGELG